MELLTYNTELFLAPPSASVFFGGFGFQNNKMYTSLQYFVIDTEPQILNSYNYDSKYIIILTQLTVSFLSDEKLIIFKFQLPMTSLSYLP
jgi:hypothetical protein